MRSCFIVERRRCHRYLRGSMSLSRRALSFKKAEHQRAIKVMTRILNFSFSNKFAHATITAFFENSCRPRGCRDDSPVFSYRFARALSYIVARWIFKRFPRGAHDPRHGVSEIYSPPLVASINISSKVSFVLAGGEKAAECGKAIPLLPVAKVNS